jgi:hypothetical protein
MAVAIIQLDAGHTVNGNPRRCYVAIDSKHGIVGTTDEGYRGYGALPKRYWHTQIPRIATTPKDYRDLLRDFPSIK